jgi:hypothetical protein
MMGGTLIQTMRLNQTQLKFAPPQKPTVISLFTFPPGSGGPFSASQKNPARDWLNNQTTTRKRDH